MYALHVGLWIAADAVLFRIVNGCYLSGAPTVGGVARWLIAWGTREVGTVLMTLQGFASNRVTWRGKEFALGRDAVVLLPKTKSE